MRSIIIIDVDTLNGSKGSFRLLSAVNSYKKLNCYIVNLIVIAHLAEDCMSS